MIIFTLEREGKRSSSGVSLGYLVGREVLSVLVSLASGEESIVATIVYLIRHVCS